MCHRPNLVCVCVIGPTYTQVVLLRQGQTPPLFARIYYATYFTLLYYRTYATYLTLLYYRTDLSEVPDGTMFRWSTHLSMFYREPIL